MRKNECRVNSVWPTVPDTQHDVDFMVKDSKRFRDSGGWGYGVFEYQPASDAEGSGWATLTDKPPPGERDAKCGFALPRQCEDKGLCLHGRRGTGDAVLSKGLRELVDVSEPKVDSAGCCVRVDNRAT